VPPLSQRTTLPAHAPTTQARPYVALVPFFPFQDYASSSDVLMKGVRVRWDELQFFHEGMKSWSCCKDVNKPVMEFDQFMKIPVRLDPCFVFIYLDRFRTTDFTHHGVYVGMY
jgi:hypothetical protein